MRTIYRLNPNVAGRLMLGDLGISMDAGVPYDLEQIFGKSRINASSELSRGLALGWVTREELSDDPPAKLDTAPSVPSDGGTVVEDTVIESSDKKEDGVVDAVTKDIHVINLERVADLVLSSGIAETQDGVTGFSLPKPGGVGFYRFTSKNNLVKRLEKPEMLAHVQKLLRGDTP